MGKQQDRHWRCSKCGLGFWFHICAYALCFIIGMLLAGLTGGLKW